MTADWPSGTLFLSDPQMHVAPRQLEYELSYWQFVTTSLTYFWSWDRVNGDEHRSASCILMANVDIKVVVSPNPAELGLAVAVNDTLLANNPQLFPSATGTIKYSDFNAAATSLVKIDQSYAKGYGNYVYTYAERGAWGGEKADQLPQTILYFAKNKTETERNTAFKTWFTKKDWTFPAVLRGIMILQDDTFQQSFNVAGEVQNAPRYFVKAFEQPEYVGPCVFKIEQFLSEVPWSAATFQSIAPQPDTVQFQFLGVNFIRSHVLHPELKIGNPFLESTTVFQRTGEIPSFNGEQVQWIFPSTKPAGRLAYVQTDEQNPVQGQYLQGTCDGLSSKKHSAQRDLMSVKTSAGEFKVDSPWMNRIQTRGSGDLVIRDLGKDQIWTRRSKQVTATQEFTYTYGG